MCSVTGECLNSVLYGSGNWLRTMDEEFDEHGVRLPTQALVDKANHMYVAALLARLGPTGKDSDARGFGSVLQCFVVVPRLSMVLQG